MIVRKLRDLALFACLSYSVMQTAYGQVPQRPAAPPQGAGAPGQTFAPGARGTHDMARRDDARILQGSSLIGASVMFQAGGSYGTLRDFVISDSGCIEYAVIGADNGLIAVPWGSGMFDVGRRAFVLDFGRDRLRDYPQLRDISELRNERVRQQLDSLRGRTGTQHGADFRPETNGRPQINPNEHGTAAGVQRFGNTAPQGTQRPANPPANREGGNREGNEGNRRER